MRPLRSPVRLRLPETLWMRNTPGERSGQRSESYNTGFICFHLAKLVMFFFFCFPDLRSNGCLFSRFNMPQASTQAQMITMRRVNRAYSSWWAFLGEARVPFLDRQFFSPVFFSRTLAKFWVKSGWVKKLVKSWVKVSQPKKPPQNLSADVSRHFLRSNGSSCGPMIWTLSRIRSKDLGTKAKRDFKSWCFYGKKRHESVKHESNIYTVLLKYVMNYVELCSMLHMFLTVLDRFWRADLWPIICLLSLYQWNPTMRELNNSWLFNHVQSILMYFHHVRSSFLMILMREILTKKCEKKTEEDITAFVKTWVRTKPGQWMGSPLKSIVHKWVATGYSKHGST